MASKFETGKTYTSRSIGDAGAVYRFKVVSRTPGTVTVELMGSKRRCGIHADTRGEFCFPLGRYSMAPVLRAEREG